MLSISSPFPRNYFEFACVSRREILRSGGSVDDELFESWKMIFMIFFFWFFLFVDSVY